MTATATWEHTDIVRIDIRHPPTQTATAALVGSKGYGLLRMVSAGIKVPPGFVLGTTFCREFFQNGHLLSQSMETEIGQEIRVLENATSKSFGSRRKPLLVSVRSGAPVSMPGMMETLLNVGLNDETVRGLIRGTGNPRLAWDSYRRMIRNYAEVVYAADTSEFDERIKAFLKRDGLKLISDLNSADLRDLCTEFKSAFCNCTGKDFPADPWIQLHKSVAAVFKSWFSKRAETYRKINNISAESGTACIIQAMVFGNAGGTSGSGVGFTRNPANGIDELYVDYLANSQGEDIVSGRHDIQDANILQQRFPSVFERLKQIKIQLENEFRDMQDFEFTVQEDELFLLQTRNGKRTPMAALRIAIDLFDEGLLTLEQALALLNGIDLNQLVQCRLSNTPADEPVASGITASIGVVSGMIALDETKAKQLSDAGNPVLLVRSECSTDDIGAMHRAVGVITATGGRTSHAAVVARQLGIACVVGCRGIQIDWTGRCLRLNGRVYGEGDYLTLDADHGLVYEGRLDIDMQKPEALLSRVQDLRKLKIPDPSLLDRIGD